MKNHIIISVYLWLVFISYSCFAIESPQYTVLHSESDFEIRLYRESAWMSASVRDISFQKATKLGFHRLYQYIRGANLNSSKIVMTAPILTSITRADHKLDYHVMFYVSTKFSGIPPSPLPELDLQLGKWNTHCVAVRKFSGFAVDDNINKEVEALVAGISKLQIYSTGLLDKSSYTVAQYNSSSHKVGRLNEVWLNVTGLARGGCKSFQRIQLFQYIQGANLNNTRISMTAPVLTSIVSDSGPFDSSSYIVQFYLPVKFQGTPPSPLPELNLRPLSSESHCIAVRKFSGFARDSNIVAEAEKLAVSLSQSPWANSTIKGDYTYAIAQYNSPFWFIKRVNEVWVDLVGSKVKGCQSDPVASY